VEAKSLTGVTSDGPATFVDEPMVCVTEHDEVVEIRRTSLTPMLDVMRIGPPRSAASREPTTSISVHNLPTEPGRNVPRPPAYPDGHPRRLDDPLDDRVAGETADRLIGQRHAQLRFSVPSGFAQNGDVGVHDHHRLLGPT